MPPKRTQPPRTAKKNGKINGNKAKSEGSEGKNHAELPTIFHAESSVFTREISRPKSPSPHADSSTELFSPKSQGLTSHPSHTLTTVCNCTPCIVEMDSTEVVGCVPPSALVRFEVLPESEKSPIPPPNIVDIIRCFSSNIKMVGLSELNEMITSLKRNETQSIIPSSYLALPAGAIPTFPTKTRHAMVSWFIKAGSDFNLPLEATSLAINLMDRSLHAMITSGDVSHLLQSFVGNLPAASPRVTFSSLKLHVFKSACLFLAAKVQDSRSLETNPSIAFIGSSSSSSSSISSLFGVSTPEDNDRLNKSSPKGYLAINDLIEYTDYIITGDDLKAMELKVASSLNYMIVGGGGWNMPTAYSFMSFLLITVRRAEAMRDSGLCMCPSCCGECECISFSSTNKEYTQSHDMFRSVRLDEDNMDEVGTEIDTCSPLVMIPATTKRKLPPAIDTSMAVDDDVSCLLSQHNIEHASCASDLSQRKKPRYLSPDLSIPSLLTNEEIMCNGLPRSVNCICQACSRRIRLTVCNMDQNDGVCCVCKDTPSSPSSSFRRTFIETWHLFDRFHTARASSPSPMRLIHSPPSMGRSWSTGDMSACTASMLPISNRCMTPGGYPMSAMTPAHKSCTPRRSAGLMTSPDDISPSPVPFLVAPIVALRFVQESLEKEVLVSLLLVDICQLSLSLSSMTAPSLVASAAILMAFMLLHPEANAASLWSASLAHYSGYSSTSLFVPLITEINDLCFMSRHNANAIADLTSSVAAIKEKYAKKCHKFPNLIDRLQYIKQDVLNSLM